MEYMMGYLEWYLESCSCSGTVVVEHVVLYVSAYRRQMRWNQKMRMCATSDIGALQWLLYIRGKHVLTKSRLSGRTQWQGLIGVMKKQYATECGWTNIDAGKEA